jgi:hypothetical protein
MSTDWRDALQQLGRQMAAREHEATLCQVDQLITDQAYGQALELLGSPRTGEARALAARAHYGLVKAACSEGAYGQARDHAVNAMNLARGNEFRGLRALIQQRLELLRAARELPSGRRVVHPVAADVGGSIGWVPVLGGYSSYGVGWGELELNEIIHLLKRGVDELDPREMRERERVIPLLALGLAQLLRELGWARDIDLIVPVPADPERAAARGYSPQEAIAQDLGALLVIPVHNDVVRQVVSTRKLQGLAPGERAYELRGVFDVVSDKAHIVSGMHILLVDDVVTYGTHFNEVSQELARAGAAQVQACAVATARDNLYPCQEG